MGGRPRKEMVLKVADMPEGGKLGVAYVGRSYHYYYDEEDLPDWEDDDVLELSPVRRGTASENASSISEDGAVVNVVGAQLDWSGLVEKGNVGLDAVTRANLGVDVGDNIKARKVKKVSARQIKISPASKINSTRLAEYMCENYTDHVFITGDMFPVMTWPKGKAWFKVSDTIPEGLVCLTKSTKIILGSEIKNNPAAESIYMTEYGCLGGMDDKIQKIREMIELPMWHPEIFKELGINAPKGVLLHGPPGTGKTLLARTIAKASNAGFKSISGPEIVSKWVGESEENLRDLFRDAKRNEEPCIIFIDEIDAITPKRDHVRANHEKQLVAQLLTLMDELERDQKVVVVAATNILNSIDPALRRPGRFDREVEIDIPNQSGRLAILEIHTRKLPLDRRVNLKLISKITHGYTGADLYGLCREAAMLALRRAVPVAGTRQDSPPVKEYLSQVSVTWSDFKQALRGSMPSALREVAVQVPNVKWEDIGGLEQTLANLREFIEWPLKYAHDVSRYGIRIPRGILMHGPPGTGKTTIAKAIANTSGYNFISIKGPELLSKWVGESERGVREVFKKAKQASPCVVFFDEIDALVPTRGNDSGSHVTDNVVSQILTEMDGLEELQGVVVIGATNRLDIIDQAMLRPGRFDRIIEVPMPTKVGRGQILKIHAEKKPMDKRAELGKIACATDGFSGADLEYVVELAAMAALRRRIGASGGSGNGAVHDDSPITQKDLENAVNQVRKERRLCAQPNG